MGRQLWSARVRGDGGLFERASIEVDDAGRFVLVTENERAASYDRAVLDRADVDRLADALCAELDQSS